MTIPQTQIPAPRIAGRKQWLIVILLMGFTLLGHFNRISITIVGAEIFIKENLFSETQMGWVYFAFLIVYTACMIPGGWVIDRIGPKGALAIMIFGSALFVALTGVVGLVEGWFGLTSFILIRGCMGGINAPLHPGCARMVSLAVPLPGRALANGLVTGAALVGISGTYYGFGMLMDNFGWQGAFLVSSSLTLGLAIVWGIVPMQEVRHQYDSSLAPELFREHRPKGTGGFLELVTNKRLIFLSLSYGAYSYFQYLFFYWMEYYFTDTLKLKIELSRLYSTIPLLAMALGMPLGGWVADRLSRTKRHPGLVPIIALILSASAGLWGTRLSDGFQVMICFSLALGLMGFCEGPYWTMGIALGRRYGGMSGAILNTVGNAGGILSPILTPYITSWSSAQTSFAIASCTCLVAALLWIPLSYEAGD